MSRTCPECGSDLSSVGSACSCCGIPKALASPAPGGAVEPSVPVVEPEVLGSLDEAERDRFTPSGAAGTWTVGPGFGCALLPLAVLAGVVLSSLVALLWVLSLGRVPASLVRLAREARRGFHRS